MKIKIIRFDFYCLERFSKTLLKNRKIATAFIATTLLGISTNAQNYTINTFTDGTSSSGTVTLRGAILAADALGGTHTITVPAGTYNLTLGEITFGNNAENIVINGAGAATTIINMTTTSQDRIFFINPPGTNPNISTTISGISFTNGHLNSDIYGGGAICAGGPSNVLSISSCIFTNNTVAASVGGATPIYGGGAICYTYGGNLSITGCSFSGNNLPYVATNGFYGGAIYYFVYGSNSLYPNSTLSITNNTFTNNITGTSASPSANNKGGAIYLLAANNGTPSTPIVGVNITRNNFVTNSAPGTGKGGAIYANNGFAAANFSINYNRFKGNTSGSGIGSALLMEDNFGNINATNNWWGCNGGPTGTSACADKADINVTATASGNTYPTTPYLFLTTTSSASSLCPSTTSTITASFLNNSAGTLIAASNLTALVGLPVTFSATLGSISNAQTTIQTSGTATATFTSSPTTSGFGSAIATVDNANASVQINVNTGTSIQSQPTASTTVCTGANASFTVAGSGTNLTYQWFKGSTQLNNGATGTGSTVTNATTATLNIANVSVADVANYHVVLSGLCGNTTSNDAALAVNIPPAIAAAGQPAATTVCTGTNATFTVTATGSATLTYQWRKGTTNLTNGATGNGSTISGATTATLIISNTAAADAATNYNVVVTNTCNSATSNNAALTVNLPPSITTQPAITTTICPGNTASFTAVASGTATLTYQWYKGTTAITNGNTPQGSIISGATTAMLTIANASPTDNATNYNVVVSNGCTATATSNNAALTVTAPTLIASGSTSGTSVISGSNYAVNGTSCAAITKILPSGAIPVSGSVTATVTVDATVQTAPGGNPYVQRHFDIVPATNPATATATLTLYFSQTDFNNYNTFNTMGGKLPTGPSDVADIPNVRIGQYHGTGTGPGNYTGSGVDIDPDDNNIVWNATYSRWEVTFNTVGFSGFFLTNMNSVMPLSLLSFTGTVQGSNALLQWTTDQEVNTDHFELQRSTDGIHFNAITNIATTGNNNSGTNNYKYIDITGTAPVYYYRLKMVDKDGKYTLGKVVSINMGNLNYIVQVLPNPFQSELHLNIVSPEQAKTTLTLLDMSGKILLVQNTTLGQGANSITIGQLGKFAKGTYLLHIFNNKTNQTIKVIRAQ